jgi:ATP-dependent RNA helicase SrmB
MRTSNTPENKSLADDESLIAQSALIDQSRFDNWIQSAQLLKTIDSLGFSQPTSVQIQAIPAILAGKDVIVSSKTGSGKTLAFLLPIIQKLLDQSAINRQSTRALVLVPTRELARQIVKNAHTFLGNTSIKADLICGGEPLQYQKALLRKNPEILVATPGRLAEHVALKATDFSGLEFLVLDEADRMLDMGLSEDVLKIIKDCRSERKTLLFSATMEQKGLRDLIQTVMAKQHEKIIIEDSLATIEQTYVLVDDDKYKEKVLLALLEKENTSSGDETLVKKNLVKKTIVFVNTKLKATQLDNVLRYHKIKTGSLHSDLTQEQRKITLDYFRQGRIDVLVATDVAARGLDIADVSLIINYDMAHSGDDYLHRVGRTGRAGQQGKAVSFIDEKNWNLTKGIERYLGIRLEPIEILGLKASYQGPDKLKASGKSVGLKKKINEKEKKSDVKKPKVKVRDRDKKNIGKRRAPSSIKHEAIIDGFAPPKKKIKQSLTEDDDK